MGGLISPDGALCLVCGKKRGLPEGLPLCAECALALIGAERESRFRCPRCQSTLYPGKPCRVCARDPDRLIEQTYAPYRYRGVPRSLVLALKFRGDTRAAALLAPAAVRALGGRSFDALVPVPLSAGRLRERGYNQARELAELVSYMTGIPVLDGLTRVRRTKRQTDLHSVQGRAKNVEGAFAPRDGANLAGRTILLTDDVRTTGATALQCAAALRSAGAKRVDLLAVCVAPGLIRGRKALPAGRYRAKKER